MVKTVAVFTTRGARRRAYTAQPPFPSRTARCLAPSPPILLTPYDRWGNNAKKGIGRRVCLERKQAPAICSGGSGRVEYSSRRWCGLADLGSTRLIMVFVHICRLPLDETYDSSNKSPPWNHHISPNFARYAYAENHFEEGTGTDLLVSRNAYGNTYAAHPLPLGPREVRTIAAF